MRDEIQKFLDGELSGQREKELLEVVKSDESLREELISQAQMDESLSSFFEQDHEVLIDRIMNETDKLQAVSRVMEGVRKSNRQRFIFSLAVCAALLLCSFLIPYFLTTKTVDGVKTNEVTKAFQNVPNQKKVEEKLENGVSLIIKGPAQYLIKDSMNVELNEGYLRALVPKSASGFTVTTPEGIIRDISTEFSVKVKNGKTELTVHEGMVEVRLHHEKEFAKVAELERVSLFQNTISLPQGIEQRGDVISINFGNEGKVTGETGLISVGNWNNVGTPLIDMPLNDNSGEPIATTVKLSEQSEWTANYVKGESQEAQLYLGRLVGGITKNQNAENVKPLEISIKEIPFEKYDVLIYYWQGRVNDKHVFTLQLNDGPKFNIERHNAQSTTSIHSFEKWKGEGDNRSGNYFIFEGVNGKNVIIKAGMPDRTDVHRQWHISGIQIVSRD